MQPIALDSTAASPASFKQYLSAIHELSRQAFLDGENPRTLVTQRAELIDRLIKHIWDLTGAQQLDAALLAVGGYGRGELHPHSDIDVAILLGSSPSDADKEHLERFITLLWDTGLEIGHSVRTIEEGIEAASADLTVMTNLLEARLLSGHQALYKTLREKIHQGDVWPSAEFFSEKLLEKQRRYRKYNDALQQLEPNVKESPGGLRDIQLIAWVANRHFGSAGLRALVDYNFLTADEFETLHDGETFLWRIRCALHYLTDRHEDRLAFDHQKAIANMLGYEGDTPNAPVEKLMKDYYSTVRELSCLNEMLLGLFDEAILHAAEEINVKPINRRFQITNNALDVTNDRVFSKSPYAMLELFLILQQQPDISHIRARTLRLLLASRHLINESFRNDLRAQSLFMEIIRQPRRIGHELLRMHKYGVLSAYLPVFAKVEGLMQFDLFHIYTVDEHALFVLKYMRRFSFPEDDDDKITLVPYVIESIPKLELLYIAGLYHDIAKGRGGDHSELGAEEVSKFCQKHSLSNFDTHLVAWLVRNHLLMSTIAQRKDIYDVSVIAAFAKEVGEQIFLDYLYLLTIADIRGTNPELFNGWKESLLAELYTATRRYLADASDLKKDTSERIRDMRDSALAILEQDGFSKEAVLELWQSFDGPYFVRHRVPEIVWHARNILDNFIPGEALVCVDNFDHRAATAIFIYTVDSANLFARTTAALNRLQLDILDARISTSANGFTLDTYMVLDSITGEPISEQGKVQVVVKKLQAALASSEIPLPTLTRAASRALKTFKAPTIVDFEYDEAHGYTVMGINTLDSPGLLSIVGQVMRDFDIQLHDARIATIGERAEDYFCVTVTDEEKNIPLGLQEKLRAAIIKALAER